MNITQDQAERYIGNPKFCTKDDAIAHVHSVNKGSYPQCVDLWLKVLKRTDLPPMEAIRLLEDIPKQNKFSEAVFGRLDVQTHLKTTLTLAQALTLLKDTASKEVTAILTERKDVHTHLKEMPSEELLTYALSARKEKVWDHVYSRTNLPSLDIINCAKAYGVRWLTILQRPDIEPADALKYAHSVNTADVWTIVLKRDDVKEYLS